MSTENLQQKIDRIGNPVEMLRNSPMGAYAFPMVPEYTNWIEEQEAWTTSAVMFDQSHHMSDAYFRGPDVKRLFSDSAINSFAKFGKGKGKQFVGCNEEGFVIGDAILFGLADDEYALVGTPPALNWMAFRAATGDYDVEVEIDPATPFNPNQRKLFRFQVQGPNALNVVEKAHGGPLPEIKFFNIGEFEIAGCTVSALNHTMVGHPGLEHTGLEMTGPFEHGVKVWAALAEAGVEFDLRLGGGRAYPTTALETGWIPLTTSAIYTSDSTKAYREWLPGEGFEGNLGIAGSFVSDNIEDYYATPWDLGLGRLIKFDHDFVGRAALEAMAGAPHQEKVWLRWNDEDVTRVMASSLFGGADRAKYMNVPMADFGAAQYDSVISDGQLVGYSTYPAYTANIGGFASLGRIAEGDAVDGAEVTIVWGEPDGGTGKPMVERHVQTQVRATISKQPLV